MNSLGAKVKIDAEGDMSVTAGLKRLYLKDTQKSIIGEAEDQKQHPLLAKEFEVIPRNLPLSSSTSSATPTLSPKSRNSPTPTLANSK